jgi:hypothetical protein
VSNVPRYDWRLDYGDCAWSGAYRKMSPNQPNVNIELTYSTCERVAMHAQFLRALAHVAGMEDQNSYDIPLLKRANSILIGRPQDTHFPGSSAQRESSRSCAALRNRMERRCLLGRDEWEASVISHWALDRTRARGRVNLRRPERRERLRDLSRCTLSGLCYTSLQQALRFMLGNHPTDHDLIRQGILEAETGCPVECVTGC